jgi:hypothetical protein
MFLTVIQHLLQTNYASTQQHLMASCRITVAQTLGTPLRQPILQYQQCLKMSRHGMHMTPLMNTTEFGLKYSART